MNYPPSKESNWFVTGACLALALLVCFVFGQALSFDFVNYDDGQYVYANPVISDGITLQSLRHIVTHPHSSNWHPLTSFSHLLDCQLYALNPFGHHLGNVSLHLATVLLLFLVLRKMTGSFWRSLFVAALFAIHPLRAESVAWISERKDVLSGFFFMLTLGAYLNYTRQPAALRRYLLLILLFTAGLTSKPMLVTTPFILLLLDWWPLNRLNSTTTKREIARLFIEKLPLLLLAIGSCAATIWAQQNAIASSNVLPLDQRLGNAVLSYTVYIKQLILPNGLSALYPSTEELIAGWKIITSLGVLAGITLAVIRNGRKRPYLLTGWFWYLGMLIPVIGILQVGSQTHADRYTYLPQIGLGIIIAWVAGDWAIARRRRIIVAAVATATLLFFIASARIQVGYWRNSYLLWTHTLACTTNNSVAHSNLGAALFIDGRTSEAIAHFGQALRINPGRAEIYNNLAAAYAEQGRYKEAAQAAYKALTLAATQCTPAVIEQIRTRLATYLTHLPAVE